MAPESDIAPAIVIVGASVRGTSLLERILASASTITGDRLDVHVVDPHPPGSGRIWRDAQSPLLIMNTVAGQSTVFTDETVSVEGPIVTGPSLAEWCRAVADDDGFADVPPHVRAEAEQTIAHTTPSRLLYGHYLRWCFARVLASAPPSVRVHVHRASVASLAPDEERWSVFLDDGAQIRADAVILAVGWPADERGEQHARVVAAGNPIDQDLSAISSEDHVVVQGLGMGFFDTLSQLTEQRGGRFVDLPDGTCRYEASGLEPSIVAGSRRGVPYRAKPDFGAPPFFPEQRVLRGALAALHDRRPVDFSRDVLPLIERDAAFDYYRALDRVRPGSVRDLDGLLEGLAVGVESERTLVARHVDDTALHLSLPRAIAVVDRVADDSEIVEAVRQDAHEAAHGLDSPLKLALHSYAAARGAVIDLVAFGGLTADSFPAYRTFLADAAAFGSGPPLRRARQLLAAHDAGIIRFTGPGLVVDTSGERPRYRSADSSWHDADHAVQAWLPSPRSTPSDPLLRSLVDAGLARSWRFPDGSASVAVDVRAQDGAVIRADGEPVRGLFSVGVPHEDIRVFTIIAPVPGTNSSVLRETDAAARAALRAAASRLVPSALEAS